jgi:hypothetical protein
VLLLLLGSTTTTDLAQWRKRNGFCTIAAAVTSARHLNFKIKQERSRRNENPLKVLLFSINQQVIIGSFDPKKEKVDSPNGNSINSFSSFRLSINMAKNRKGIQLESKYIDV